MEDLGLYMLQLQDGERICLGKHTLDVYKRQGVAVINDMIVVIENRDGNTNVRFNKKETLERIFKRLEASEMCIRDRFQVFHT